MTCQHTDTVLAHFLDGDGAQTAYPHDVADHLETCELCCEALRAGRRLDALLAAGAGQGMDSARAEALLEKVLARAEPAPVAAPRPRAVPRVLTGTGLLVTGFLVAGLFLPREAAGTLPPPIPPAVEIGALTDAIFLTDSPGPRRTARRTSSGAFGASQPIAVPQTDSQVRNLAGILGDFGLSAGIRANLVTRSLALGLPYPEEATGRDLLDRMRLEAGRALLASHHPDALATWIDLVAVEADGRVLRELLAAGREREALRRRLRHQLREAQIGSASLTLAIRLALPELDRLLVQHVRRNPEIAGGVARELSSLQERPNRVALLLDVWTDLQIRGELQDDEDTARLLFAQQPGDCTALLIETATSTGNAPLRQRCLLALSVRRDANSASYLLSVIQSPSQPDSILAAYAMSQLPATSIETVVEENLALRRIRRPWLLHAAMASAHCQEALAWLPEMELTPQERQFLAAGSFNRTQFPIAAALFRERGSSGY